jgi:hypothetical protein
MKLAYDNAVTKVMSYIISSFIISGKTTENIRKSLSMQDVPLKEN